MPPFNNSVLFQCDKYLCYISNEEILIIECSYSEYDNIRSNRFYGVFILSVMNIAYLIQDEKFQRTLVFACTSMIS